MSNLHIKKFNSIYIVSVKGIEQGHLCMKHGVEVYWIEKLKLK